MSDRQIIVRPLPTPVVVVRTDRTVVVTKPLPAPVITTVPPSVVKVTANPTSVVQVLGVGLQGPVGPPGPTGPAGGQNLFVQQTEPMFVVPGIWVELNPDDSIKTFWVST